MESFGLFVRCRIGRLVPRYGVPGRYIGARRARLKREQRRAGQPTVTWDPAQIVAIPISEYRRFRREYDGALRRFDLLRATRDEYEAYLLAQKQAESVNAEGQHNSAAVAAAAAAVSESESDEVAT